MDNEQRTDTGRLVAVQPADLPRVVDLLNAAYRGQDSQNGWTDERGILDGARTTVELLRNDLSRKNTASFLKWLIGDDEHIYGTVLLEARDTDTWSLGSFAVDPAHQARGIGKAILADAERWAEMRGVKRLHMTVITVRTELISWYLRRGYKPTGEIVPFPYEDKSVGVPLRSDLKFAVLEKGL